MGDTTESRLPSPRDLQALIRAERAALPFLVWRDGAGEQHILALTPDLERVTVGRREQSDVALTWDQEVSRTHAYLEPLGDTWTLIDDGLSRNGSFVNGSRVSGRRRLQDNDKLTFGKTRMSYREPTAEHDASTARTPGTPGVPLSETQRKVLIALCRPIVNEDSATAATNAQIAAEVHLSVDAVKSQLRVLFERFKLGDLPQIEKRNRLVAIAIGTGVVAPHDF